jgi:hypothetical protein
MAGAGAKRRLRLISHPTGVIARLLPFGGRRKGPCVIRHIVFFSARDPADRDKMFEGLALLTSIAHADVIEVARNRKIDQLANDADVVVYAEFADEDALAAFKADPAYQQSIRHVRPLREMRIAADYDNATAARPSAAVRQPPAWSNG